jgi:hypothetical protein
VRPLGTNLPGRFNSVQEGHGKIQYDDIGGKLLGSIDDFLAICSFAANLPTLVLAD